jgi:hypothetical protein
MTMITYPANEGFELSLRGLSIGGRKTADLSGAELFRLMAAKGIQVHATYGKQQLEMILAEHIRENGEL